MRAFVRSLVAALGIALIPALVVSLPSASALAQADQGQEQIKQIALTDAQITQFIAAQKDMNAIFAKIPQGTEKPDPKIMAQLEATAKKYKFASFEDYNDVAANIGLVMAGIDPQTKKYVGAEAVLKQQIAAVQADKQMPANERKQALDQLNEALKAVVPVQYQQNIALVQKYYEKLAALMPQQD